MPRAIASNAIKCQSQGQGNPVDAIVVVFDDGGTKVLCPAEKACHAAGPCNYESRVETVTEAPAPRAVPQETDPIGSRERREVTLGMAAVEPPEQRDPIGSQQRQETSHEISDEDIFNLV